MAALAINLLRLAPFLTSLLSGGPKGKGKTPEHRRLIADILVKANDAHSQIQRDANLENDVGNLLAGKKPRKSRKKSLHDYMDSDGIGEYSWSRAGPVEQDLGIPGGRRPRKRRLRGSAAVGGKNPKGKVPPALQRWTAHLNEFRRKHPHLSMKDAMKGAKKTYRK